MNYYAELHDRYLFFFTFLLSHRSEEKRQLRSMFDLTSYLGASDVLVSSEAQLQVVKP